MTHNYENLINHLRYSIMLGVMAHTQNSRGEKKEHLRACHTSVDQSSDLQYQVDTVPSCNPGAWEAETRDFPRASWIAEPAELVSHGFKQEALSRYIRWSIYN